MESDKPASRRRYSAQTKAQVMADCNAPGASVAKVAMAHGINTNVVHGWRQLAREEQHAAPAPTPAQVSGFVPVPLPLPLPVPSAPAPVGELRIELQRGTTTVEVTWPLSAAAECAVWLREVLR